MHKNTARACATAPILILSACVTPAPLPLPEERMAGEERPCTGEAAQKFLGDKAAQAIGQQIAELTGAAIYQWVGPNMAVTMDYRMDRVRVSYNDAMIITAISCG